MTSPTPQAPAREAVEHELKCWLGPFDAMAQGHKTFEFRKNDRDFEVGDTLRLRRFQPIGQKYTGEVMVRTVTHILRNGFGLPDGYCVMSLDSALLAAKQEELDKMRGILGGVVELARDAHAHWDGDRDAKVGKLLLALAGHVPRYDPRADALHAALSPSQGEKS